MNATDEIKGFIRQVVILLAAGVALGAYPIYTTWGPEALTGALIGCGISTVNVIAGVVSIVWAIDKPQPVFLKVILGGMAARMAAIFGILIVLVKLTELAVYPLVSSMFIFYLAFQVLELRFVVNRGQESTGV